MNTKRVAFPPTLLLDFYKLSHREQYHPDTEYIYSTWTPRGSRLADVNEVVAYGFKGFIEDFLIDYFNEMFFSRPKADVVAEYERILIHCLGIPQPYTKHIADLHDLGYLPLHIKAVKEGTKVGIRTPMLTQVNTDPRFFWLGNSLETIFSCETWQSCTSATIANEYRKLLEKYSMDTVGNIDGVPFQGHDFSMRGMAGWWSSAKSGSAHLLSFVGTDTVPAILYHEQHYGADITKELVGCSIPATEHSVSCTEGQINELGLFKRLITEVYPSGFLAIVSDTWDLWKVVGEYLPALKEIITKRNGRVVIRPDSGVPEDIICGDPNGTNEYARKGLIESLWDIFGGTTTDQGYKVLDYHIGAIYGDSITLERAETICARLKAKGFASTNIVLGIGSYTYQYTTRDTFGFAMKATHAVVGGENRLLFKDPVTDNGLKKSQRGKVVVYRDKEGFVTYTDGLDSDIDFEGDMLETIFINGKYVGTGNTLAEIRERIRE